MEKVLLLRYGEIHLKGKNRGCFDNQLIKNILQTAKKDGFEPKAIVGLLRLLKKDKEKEKEMKRVLREYANSLKLNELEEII